jgi:alpha-methylacyl-CoA racemase
MSGPLTGVRIIEIAGIGPGPFCAMMLADQGADVIRVDRPGGGTVTVDPALDVMNRSRRSIVADLKTAEGKQLVRDLAKTADGVIEGFRPGVMERLGLGPEVLLADNPKLVYGRMTGWGQDGPYAQLPGHDINYIALAGALHCIGEAGGKPVVPLNLIGDFGGGGLMLAYGMVTGILSARASGKGQVIDCAMTDGVAALTAMVWSFINSKRWSDERGVSLLDGGAPFYDSYETSDGKYISLGSIEPQFYAEMRRALGIDTDTDFDVQHDKSRWPAQKAKVAAIIRSRTRQDWCDRMETSDVCFAPILSMQEAAEHPHAQARGTFVKVDGHVQPAPAPRFLGTPAGAPRPVSKPGAQTAEILAELGYDDARGAVFLTLAQA